AAVAAALVERGETGRAVIITDARRREHYWTVVDLGDPTVIAGPGLTALDDIDAVAGIDAGVRRIEPSRVDAAALARLALRHQAEGLAAGPAQALYLREPDVTPAKGPKRVTG